jgi:hypothetical protein
MDNSGLTINGRCTVRLPGNLVAACCALLLWLVPLGAWGESQLGCLEKSQGRTLTWNARWADDRQDDNVEYEVTNVTKIDKVPDRIVTLNLKAVRKAVVSVRTIKADSEESARRLCDRLFEKREMVDPFKSAEVEREFIHYSKDGWVRGYAPSNKKLVECTIATVVFSCAEDDKLRYGNSLKSVQEQVRWLEE